MKLIYAKGACSLSVHIMLEELGFKYETLQVSLKDKTVLEKFNPNGYVPVLVLDQNETLTEAAVILQYLAEKNARYDLLPESGTMEKAICLEWLTYISTELHKAMAPLFRRDQLKEEYLNAVTTKINKRLKFMDDHLSVSKFLTGEDFTIADMYGIAILRIMDHIKIDLTKFPSVSRYKVELEKLPVVSKVVEAEARDVMAKVA